MSSRPFQLRSDQPPRPAEVTVVIPVLNEEEAIGRVLSAVPAWVREVIVVDNGSTDRTADVARRYGAHVIAEPQRGYGSACLAGMSAMGEPEVIVFLDGDFSDHPEEMGRLVAPILENQADLVIGSRIKGSCQHGALTLPQRFGNALACGLMRLFVEASHTDLGPFRAIRYSSLKRLKMNDRGYGWTIQMQIRAARMGMRVMEVPVSYRRRLGQSKISGTWRGTIAAGAIILLTIWREVRAVLSAHSHENLIVFARYPEAGKTKTRLIPALGPQAAAELQRQMTSHTLHQARLLAQERHVDIEVRFAGGDAARMRQLYGPGPRFSPQGDGDLGLRLHRAAQEAFNAGTTFVALIGSDCPYVTPELLNAAFDALRQHDVVLGPAIDGGYYLIGLRHCYPKLFQDIDWGSDRVYEQTRQAARKLGLSIGTLPLLADVDRPEDLNIWYAVEKETLAAKAPRISVVIPALNEERLIHAAIASAFGSEAQARRALSPQVETIVVDGGSSDRTVEIAGSQGAKVVCSPRGRACQMNVGAASASGDYLLFLHADSVLPPKFASDVIRMLNSADTVAGAFALTIDPSTPLMRLFSETTNFRSRLLQMPYGDQAIFLRRSTFHSIGGFPEISIMEDVEFVRGLKRLGRVRIAHAIVRTSGRRWQEQGAWRTSVLNQVLMLAHYCGASPGRLYNCRESERLKPHRLGMVFRFAKAFRAFDIGEVPLEHPIPTRQ